jgi:hypothetical protein
MLHIWLPACLPHASASTCLRVCACAARKFDRPATAAKPSGAGLKRKLLISPEGALVYEFV